jgi:hypothetical protein
VCHVRASACGALPGRTVPGNHDGRVLAPVIPSCPRYKIDMTLALLFVSLASAALPAPVPRCGTPELAPDFTRRGPVGHLRGDGPGRAVAAMTPDRDAYGLYPNYRVSEHFIAKWGNTGSVTQGEVESLLAAFERAWEVEIGEMGHPAPDGTETWLFNIYIGDTGDNTPSSGGAGGYYYRDADGYPMIVVGRDTLRYEEFAKGTAAHEFYHALQDEVLSYPYEGDSAWYWEATAEWASGETLPDNPSYASFIYGYAYNPQLSVEFFDYPDTWALEEYHQYGAFIFPRFVSEVLLDREAVARTWITPLGATPLESLRAEIEAGGTSLEDAFGAFAARNAAWDYEDGDLYFEIVDTYDYYYPGERHEVAEVGPTGSGGSQTPATEELPQQWAYNVVSVDSARDGMDVTVQVSAEGQRGSPADWRVSIVDEGGDRQVLDVSTGSATTTVRGADRFYIVAASVAPSSRNGERFAWAWDVAPAAPPEDTGPDVVDEATDDKAGERSGGGCAHVPGDRALGAAAAFAALLGGARRRR